MIVQARAGRVPASVTNMRGSSGDFDAGPDAFQLLFQGVGLVLRDRLLDYGRSTFYQVLGLLRPRVVTSRTALMTLILWGRTLLE